LSAQGKFILNVEAQFWKIFKFFSCTDLLRQTKNLRGVKPLIYASSTSTLKKTHMLLSKHGTETLPEATKIARK